MTQPILETQRLILRPFTLADAPRVQELAGDRDIAATTGSIPHPYENGMAEDWIKTHPESFANDQRITYAITLKTDNGLAGCVNLFDINRKSNRAEMGYWIGKPFWRAGYATEAAKAMLKYGFDEVKLNRILAKHAAHNPASGRIMQKMGMTYEGCLRQHAEKWGVCYDLVVYGILKSEYEALNK